MRTALPYLRRVTDPKLGQRIVTANRVNSFAASTYLGTFCPFPLSRRIRRFEVVSERKSFATVDEHRLDRLFGGLLSVKTQLRQIDARQVVVRMNQITLRGGAIP